MDGSPITPDRKKRVAPSRAGASDREPLAIIEVPADPRIFEEVMLSFQPAWIRFGGWLVLVSFGIVGVVGLIGFPGGRFVGLFSLLGWENVPRLVIRIMVGVPAALLYLGIMGLRRRMLRRQVERWHRYASRAGCDRIELYDDGLVRGGKHIPWSKVSDAVELDGPVTLLAVQVNSDWIVLPVACFNLGNFRSAQALLMRKLGDKLRIVQQ